ncbi:MAG: glycosyltransferase family 1 protein [Magnetospirillum sp.]|nr:glycosyltransferase family 1 protein [Magnetospirillum sp.]
MSPSLRIALVGETFAASRTPQRVQAMRDMGHTVTAIPTTVEGRTYETRPSLMDRLRYRLRLPADPAGANAALVEAARGGLDLVWLDNAAIIRAATLEEVRRLCPRVKLAWYCEDDMMNPRLGSRWLDRALPLFDLWITTKSFNARPEEMPSRGVRRILVVDNCYDAALHRPATPTADDFARLGADIAFIGTFEAPRAADLLALARAGLNVRVWGNGWAAMIGAHPLLKIENRPIYNQDFALAIACTRINLCFLRKANRDLQTCRSMEIPACGGFMAHERNDEIARLFLPDRHAAYFSHAGELVELCRQWLADETGRARVAAAGRARVEELGLDHATMIGRALAALFPDQG